VKHFWSVLILEEEPFAAEFIEAASRQADGSECVRWESELSFRIANGFSLVNIRLSQCHVSYRYSLYLLNATAINDSPRKQRANAPKGELNVDLSFF
jgi:hypothetical protein